MTEKKDTNAAQQGLLEFKLALGNLNEAYKRVKRNDGSGGMDRMKTDDLQQYLESRRNELIKS
jgi:hypothetical protein